MRERSSLPPRAGTVAFGLIAAAAFAYLLWKGRGNNFYYDEWSWIEQRHSGLHWIISSYNQHLLALPIAVYQVLFRTVGLSHYWVYRLLEVLVHLGCAAALFAFARRRIGPVAALLTLPVLVLGSGWEYVLEPINLGFVASLGLSITALLLLDLDTPRAAVGACALLVLSLACSELTVVFALGIAVERIWSERRLTRVWVWGVPLALYALWWLAYHEPSTARENLTAAPAFGVDLAASAIGGLFGLSLDWGRPLLLTGVLLLGWRVLRPRGLGPRLAGLLVAAGGFWLLVALGRAQNGVPASSRYIYTGVVLIVLIAAEALRGAQPSRRALAIAGLVALFSLAGNIRLLTSGEATLAGASRVVSAELGALEIARATAPAGLAIDPTTAPVLFAGQYFAAIAAIGSSPADPMARLLERPEEVRVAADGVLVRAGALTVTASAPAAPAGRPPAIEAIGSESAAVAGSCETFTPRGPDATVVVSLPPGRLELQALSAASVTVQVRRLASAFDAAAITSVPPRATIALRAPVDHTPLPWHVRIAGAAPFRACARA